MWMSRSGGKTILQRNHFLCVWKLLTVKTWIFLWQISRRNAKKHSMWDAQCFESFPKFNSIHMEASTLRENPRITQITPNQFSVNPFPMRSNPWKPLKVHQACGYGFLKRPPKEPLSNAGRKPPCPKSWKYVSSWFWVTGMKLVPSYSIREYFKEQCSHAALFYTENGVNACAPQFSRGCSEGVTCTPRIYSFEIRGAPVQTWIHTGML